MDKYDIVLDLIEHPSKYSPERIEEILSDHEIREIYNLLCKTDSAISSTGSEIDVNTEWQVFSRTHHKPKLRFPRRASRAASIAAIAFTSLAAVAIGITVAVKTFDHKPQPAKFAVESTTVSVIPTSQPEAKNAEDSTEVAGKPVVTTTPILFEDSSLDEILSHVAEVHGATVEYVKPETSQLHLYYKFDPAASLRETIEQLNTFEQINIRIKGKKIIVE